ncbi:MAG: SDR family NAD(P)-dependent oxidoreductase, partial [Dissulfurimicrobium sp.]
MDKYELQNGFEWDDKVILITGGTGSFGKAFVKKLLSEYHPRAIRIYSRDELKQFHIQQEINDTRLRFFIGDVRDKERLIKAARNADVIVHAAAMKQVPACEYNPFEAVKTNIIGAT